MSSRRGGGPPNARRNLDGYGAPLIEWERVRAVMDAEITQAPGTGGPGRHTAWLTTSDPAGGPHVMAVGVIGAAEPYGATRFDCRPDGR
jgi:hypothetical protein